MDANTLLPNTSQYYSSGGGMLLDLEINSFTDVWIFLKV
jgi:hypothetical protein